MSYVVAKYSYEATEIGSVSFNEGDIIQVINKLPSGWYDGITIKNGLRGWFPSNFTEEKGDLELAGPENFGSTEQQELHQISKEILKNDTKLERIDLEKKMLMEYRQSLMSPTPSQRADSVDILQDENEDESSANVSLMLKILPLAMLQLPENWGIKYDQDGTKYYYNQLTNETKWTFNGPVPGSAVPFSPIESSNDSGIFTNDFGPSTSQDEIESDGLVFTWNGLTSNIILKLKALIRHCNEKAKDSYVSTVVEIMDAIQLILHSSDTASKRSHILESHKCLSDGRALILNWMARLILASKTASNVWPPPNAEKNLKKTTFELLSALKTFISEGVKLNISLKSLTKQEIAQFSRNTNENFSDSDPALIAALESKMVDMSTLLSSLDLRQEMTGGSQGETIVVSSLNRADLIKLIQRLVKLVGSFLSRIDGLSMDASLEELAIDFKVSRMSLLNGVTELVMSTKQTKDEHPTTDWHGKILRSVESVVNGANELIIATKFLIEQKENLDQETLKSYIDSFSIKQKVAKKIIIRKMPETAVNTSRSFSPKGGEVSTPMDSVGPFSPSERLSSNDRVSSTDRQSSIGSAGPESMNGIPTADLSSAWFLKSDHVDRYDMVTTAGILRGGSVEAFVVKMTSHLESDDNFTTNFLLTYRTVTSTTKFLALLFDRFSLAIPDNLNDPERALWLDRKLKPIRFRVYIVIKSWLESHVQQDQEDHAGLLMISDFAQTRMKEHMVLSHSKIMLLVEQRLSGEFKPIPEARSPDMPTDSLPAPILPRFSSKFKLTDMDPLEFARQYTLVEYGVFQDLDVQEFLHTVWSTYATKRIEKIIIMSRNFAAWVSYSILQAGDSKKRAKNMGFFINVAENFLSLQNYNAYASVMQGLEHDSVLRLDHSWALLNLKQKEQLNSLHSLGPVHEIFQRYRKRRPNKNLPSIPLLPAILNDLEIIKSTMPTYLHDPSRNIFNYEKLNSAAELLKETRLHFEDRIPLKVLPEVRRYLSETLGREAYSENELLILSLHVEPPVRPRAPPSSPEQLTNLLQNTGLMN